MTRNYDNTPTLLGYSEEAVGVIAGGGIGGFMGIVIHEPTEVEFNRISNDLDDNVEPKGIFFGYSDVATITISGLKKWTNFNLSGAPNGRQDIAETGPIRIEVFDEADMHQYIEEKSKVLDKLGIKFIG